LSLKSAAGQKRGTRTCRQKI